MRYYETRTFIDCPECHGDGGYDDPHMAQVMRCESCNGTGILEAEVGDADDA